MVIFPLRSNKAPAVPKGTNWQDYKGEATTAMVGVMIPRGVFIIDIDTYKGVSTDDIDSALGVNLDWDNSELQSTLNGGMHYAFKVPTDSDLPNGSNLLGVDGFDSRSSGKGYIATGEGYENLTFHDDIIEALQDELPELPQTAIDKLSSDSRDPFDDSDCGLMEMVAAQPHEISFEEVKSYVELLSDDDASDQDTWLKVGMALWHQLGEEGWELFDEFSQRSPSNYDEDKNRRRWESFARKQPTNPVTFASVISLAGGAKARTRIQTEIVKRGIDEAETLDDITVELERLANIKIDNLTLDVALKNVQIKYQEILGKAPSLPAIRKELKRLRGDTNNGDFVDNYVYMTATAEYTDRTTKSVMKREAFNVKHSRETPLNGEGERQTPCQFAADRIDVVENSMYFPAADEVFTHEGLDYVNRYKPADLAPVKAGTTDIVERIKGHIAHLLVDPREQQIIIDYLAHNVQFPGVKLNWAIVLQGVQGDGKSLLAEMMRGVMGSNNVRIMNVQSLESSFTGWSTGQCMTFIEELKLDNKRKYEVLNNLKPYISNPVVEEHKKGKDPYSVINTTNYFALTNFKDAIPIDPTDRRYCILFSQWQRKEALEQFMLENEGYYEKLYDDIRKSFGELLDWLRTHKISKEFMSCKRAPDTNAKNMMMELSKSSTQIILEDALEEFGEDISCGENEIDVTYLGHLIKEKAVFDSKWEDFPKTGALKNALLNLGYEAIGRKRTKFSETSKHYIYSK